MLSSGGGDGTHIQIVAVVAGGGRCGWEPCSFDIRSRPEVTMQARLEALALMASYLLGLS
jgi:hypothetical protein